MQEGFSPHTCEAGCGAFLHPKFGPADHICVPASKVWCPSDKNFCSRACIVHYNSTVVAEAQERHDARMAALPDSDSDICRLLQAEQRPQPEKLLRRSTQAEHDALERAIVMADVGDGAGGTDALDDVDVCALDIDSLVAEQNAPPAPQCSIAGEAAAAADGCVQVAPREEVLPHDNVPAAGAAEESPKAFEPDAAGTPETMSGASAAVQGEPPHEGGQDGAAAVNSEKVAIGEEQQEATAGMAATGANAGDCEGMLLLQDQFGIAETGTEDMDSFNGIRVSGIKIDVLDPVRKSIKTKTSKGTILTGVADALIKPGLAYVVADCGRAKGSTVYQQYSELLLYCYSRLKCSVRSTSTVRYRVHPQYVNSTAQYNDSEGYPPLWS